MTVALMAPPEASGRRKAAITLVALGPERAAVLLRGLEEDEVLALAKEISELGPVSPEEVRGTLAELGRGLRTVATLPAPGKRYAKDLLVQALGPDRGRAAGAVLDQEPPFTWLSRVDPDTAAGVLTGEPPAAVALALAHLEPRPAAALLVRLPEERRTLVATRMAALGAVHPDTLVDVETALKGRVEDVLTAPVLPLQGPVLLAGVLAKAGKEASRGMLQVLSAADPELAEQVRSALFTFDDLCRVETRQMQVLLREVDMRQLAVAIATASPSVQAVFTGALSERARESLLEEIDLAGKSRPSEVAEARSAVVAVARRCEEEGTVVLSQDEEEAL